jgi:hypothetical protein
MYKNSILVKIWRTSEIEIKDDQIKLKTFFQLQFMKKIIKLNQIFINMVDNGFLSKNNYDNWKIIMLLMKIECLRDLLEDNLT